MIINEKTRRLTAVIFGVIFIAVISGCASAPPTQDELLNADYGSPISQEDAISKATSFVRQYLKDPDSAKFEWSQVQRGWMREAPIHGGSLRFGYILNANINAKNSYGGYTGYKPYRFLFFNGTLASVYAQQELQGSYGNTPFMGKIY